MQIPFSPPDITELEIENVVEALKSGWITTGPKTKQLEKKIAEFCHTNKAAAMNSATACMEMTLRLLGVGPGDEVITSAYTYTSSASVIDHVGAKIVLVDTAKDSFEMDYDQLSEAITENTKVIIPVDIGGMMCDYDRIFEIVENKKSLYQPSQGTLQEKFDRVIVMADAAHSLGATYKGKMSGEVADFTSFSFHAVKNFTTAEGGAITWKDIPNIDNEDIYKQFMLLTLHGQSKDALAKTKLGAWEYDIVAPNFKANMTDVHAAIGLAQFKRYPKLLARRQEIIKKYNEAFDKLPTSYLQHSSDERQSSGHLYLLRINGIDTETRNQIIEELAQVGIASNVHYKPLPMMTAYKNLGFSIKDYPNAYKMYENEISLPLHTLLTDEEVAYIINNIINILRAKNVL
ncbi:DegT/DnrJ/EryC1/StrS family aminotransferase [Aerococcus sp. UMB7834]|uniref:DegT/DnrJ/EryC1/StrS family aminotransferase n=1 Tax=Aerococcus sp. UMB7834 TaxID=3046342 RepID=UPI002550728F|nr:DegT/DnrJ/EryC1/StrS family aminotransferase [Aerococcus sp. UMB7834]MDK6805090.1 DegT/DnrJ/EryC1/StrS family aminotransferase [Aerococcus sp. UMB7834]